MLQNFYSFKFLEDLAEANSMATFKKEILRRLNFLAKHHKLYMPFYEQSRKDVRYKEIKEFLNINYKNWEKVAEMVIHDEE